MGKRKTTEIRASHTIENSKLFNLSLYSFQIEFFFQMILTVGVNLAYYFLTHIKSFHMIILYTFYISHYHHLPMNKAFSFMISYPPCFVSNHSIMNGFGISINPFLKPGSNVD